MTAQDAFHNWLVYWAAIAAGIIALAFGFSVFVAVATWPRKRDEQR
jgi:hypothetical protein